MIIRYLSVNDVLDIHHEQISEFGGSFGVRDEFLLISAVSRPQSGYYSTLIEQASALWESLSQNRPFIDGNKRTALDATLTFLAINGYRLNVSDEELTKFFRNTKSYYLYLEQGKCSRFCNTCN